MRTIKTDFKRAGKYFIVSVLHFLEAMASLVGVACGLFYCAMNGRFYKFSIKKPYVYLWRVLTWGTLVWVVMTYVCVPFFRWWDSAMEVLGNMIWG